MIYHLILYEFSSGKGIFETSFKNNEDNDIHLDHFSGFFFSINKFMTSVMFNIARKIQKIELDNFIIIFTPIIFESEFDLITVFDKTDFSLIDSMISEIKNVIYGFPDIFNKWDGCSLTDFKIVKYALKEKINSIIKRRKEIKKNCKISRLIN